MVPSLKDYRKIEIILKIKLYTFESIFKECEVKLKFILKGAKCFLINFRTWFIYLYKIINLFLRQIPFIILSFYRVTNLQVIK